MNKYQKSKIKDQNNPVIPSDLPASRCEARRAGVEGSLSPANERKGFLHALRLVGMTMFLIFEFYLLTFNSGIFAVSPTIAPKLSVTPIASPSATLTPTGTLEDEKVQEVRELNKKKAIEIKLNQIKERIEKKAYTGTIVEITDSTLTINNFRGKQRVRIAEDTTIIDANKKEIKAGDLAVDDKVIALGEVDANETLNAKRVIIVPKPKIVAAKRLTIYGSISKIDSKASQITITGTKDKEASLKIDSKTFLTRFNDAKTQLKLKDIKTDQKVIAVYPETTEGKAPIAIDIFILQ